MCTSGDVLMNTFESNPKMENPPQRKEDCPDF